LVQTKEEEEAFCVIVATNIFGGQGIAPEPLNWVLLCVILGDPEKFEFLRKEQVAKSCRVGREVVAVTDFGSLVGAAHLVDPVACIVAATCVAGDVAVCVASTFAIAAATSSFGGTVVGTTTAAAATVTATTPLVVATL
jgi:hypothetical protein